MKKLRLGIIGQGRSGFTIHTRALECVKDHYEISAVCDIDRKRCRDAHERFGSRVYTDFHKMLAQEKLDVVVNATPSHLHVPITLEVLDYDVHVLCEKPLASSIVDCDRLIRKAKRSRKLLAVFQQSVFAPYFRKVREVVDSGVLGRLVMIKVAFSGYARRWDWQTVRAYDGGSLLNTGPHPLGQVMLLYGSGMPEVMACMDNANASGDAEDHVKMLLQGRGRPMVDFEVSSCCAYPLYTYQIYGTCGGLSGDMKHIRWRYFDPVAQPRHRLERAPLAGRGFCRENLEWREEEWTAPVDETFADMGALFYQNLYQAITRGEALAMPLREVRRQIAIMEEALRQNPGKLPHFRRR